MARQVRELLELTTARLSSFNELARLDAQVVLAHVLGTTRSWVLAHPESPADAVHADQLEALVHSFRGYHAESIENADVNGDENHVQSR